MTLTPVQRVQCGIRVQQNKTETLCHSRSVKNLARLVRVLQDLTLEDGEI